jgi:hypothetical protein
MSDVNTVKVTDTDNRVFEVELVGGGCGLHVCILLLTEAQVV